MIPDLFHRSMRVLLLVSCHPSLTYVKEAHLTVSSTLCQTGFLQTLTHWTFQTLSRRRVEHSELWETAAAAPVLLLQFGCSSSASPVLLLQFCGSSSAAPVRLLQFCGSSSAAPVRRLVGSRWGSDMKRGQRCWSRSFCLQRRPGRRITGPDSWGHKRAGSNTGYRKKQGSQCNIYPKHTKPPFHGRPGRPSQPIIIWTKLISRGLVATLLIRNSAGGDMHTNKVPHTFHCAF